MAQVAESRTIASAFLYEEGKVWKYKGHNGSISPTLGHSNYECTDYIHGDTLIESKLFYKLYTHILYENGDREVDSIYVPGEVENSGYFDFTLNEGSFILCEDFSTVKYGWQVTEISDTILSDGILRRCQKLDFIIIDTDEADTTCMKKDVWIEGIGSLINGLYLEIPINTGGRYELQSVSLNGRYIYDQKGRTYEIGSITSENKVWHCTKKKDGSDLLEDEFYYIQDDTIINGKSAYKVFLKYDRSQIECYYQGAIYEYGKQVFYCPKGKKDFSLLYNFDLLTGETVCINERIYRVSDRDEIDVCGHRLTRIRIVDEVNTECSNVWLEGFGSLSGLLSDSYEAFSECEVDNKVVLTSQEINTSFKKPSWVGAVWSYLSYNKEGYEFIRYTVLDEPEIIGRKTYYPLVQYSTCAYEKGKEKGKWRIRQEGNKVYILAFDSKDYGDITSGIRVARIGNDYVLYDFAYTQHKWCCTSYQDVEYTDIYMEDTTVTYVEGSQQHRVILVGENNKWIDGIGSTRLLMHPIITKLPNEPYGTELNYFRSADGKTVYFNPIAGSNIQGFKIDDCSLIYEELPPVLGITPIQKDNVRIVSVGQTLLCTSPDAVKLEVYTMDAVKVGEAAFANSKATVKMGKVPATYLYIVTYPDGRRESGKVAIGN